MQNLLSADVLFKLKKIQCLNVSDHSFHLCLLDVIIHHKNSMLNARRLFTTYHCNTTFHSFKFFNYPVKAISYSCFRIKIHVLSLDCLFTFKVSEWLFFFFVNTGNFYETNSTHLIWPSMGTKSVMKRLWYLQLCLN